jgi:hypothetical protein
MTTAKSNVWPRVISRGPLKGRRFDNMGAYMKALNAIKEAPGSKNGKVVPGDDQYFEFKLVQGRLEMTITGDPRIDADVDAVLNILANYGSA